MFSPNIVSAVQGFRNMSCIQHALAMLLLQSIPFFLTNLIFNRLLKYLKLFVIPHLNYWFLAFQSASHAL